ncbi:hypothetical protein [Solimicrobium silvestre]|uniref:DUF1376 domain-containing protein n=1 Tax=Solimicrobium silvestre TaxID=2099400 RepID=A0A2S9GY54_9BURK|nr:hypothetical protein [Solimicrobium silvestre]PRC92655.1 hypothetical protein S2091_2710 [Solimicrobium silvestre]
MSEMQNNNPAPYPPDTKAKGWRFELDLEQISQSDTWALASLEIRPWLLMLWSVSWQQTPCGSLTGDDEIIAARIGMKLTAFKKCRSVLLRGWVSANDGRLYHPVVTQRVLSMIDVKNKEKDRKAAYRAKMSGIVPRDNQGTDAGQDARRDADGRGSDPGEDATGTGTGTGTSFKSNKDSSSSNDLPENQKFDDEFHGKAPMPKPEEPAPDTSEATKFAVALRKQGVKVTAVHPTLQIWVDRGVTMLQANEAIQKARQYKPHPEQIEMNYLNTILCEALKPKAAKSAPMPEVQKWHESAAGIQAKAKEFGLTQESGEHFPYFRDRVAKAVREART